MDEYIGRESIYKTLSMEKPFGWNNDDLAKLFREAKPADVVPVRHAYWVPEEHVDQVSPTTTHRYTWYYCSECGRRLIGYKNPIDAPYCHCGAKMDGGEDDGTGS